MMTLHLQNKDVYKSPYINLTVLNIGCIITYSFQVLVKLITHKYYSRFTPEVETFSEQEQS